MDCEKYSYSYSTEAAAPRRASSAPRDRSRSARQIRSGRRIHDTILYSYILYIADRTHSAETPGHPPRCATYRARQASIPPRPHREQAHQALPRLEGVAWPSRLGIKPSEVQQHSRSPIVAYDTTDPAWRWVGAIYESCVASGTSRGSVIPHLELRLEARHTVGSLVSVLADRKCWYDPNPMYSPVPYCDPRYSTVVHPLHAPCTSVVVQYRYICSYSTASRRCQLTTRHSRAS
jgi:hypothetical protein